MRVGGFLEQMALTGGAGAAGQLAGWGNQGTSKQYAVDTHAQAQGSSGMYTGKLPPSKGTGSFLATTLFPKDLRKSAGGSTPKAVNTVTRFL